MTSQHKRAKKPTPIAIEQIEIDGQFVKGLPFTVTTSDDGSITVHPDIYRDCPIKTPIK